MSESDFWRSEATLDDIAGVPPVSLKESLDAIIPVLDKQFAMRPDLEYPQILEIGCGIGRLTYPVLKHFKKADVYGIDISQQFLEVAVDKGKKLKRRPKFYKTTGVKLPLGNYDAIFTMLTIQHLPHNISYGYILDAGKMLNYGGVLRFQYVEGNIDHDNNHQLSRTQVERWVKDAGLTLVTLDEGLIHPQWNWITAVKA